MKQKQPVMVAGFWKRVLTDAIDALLLGIVGFIITIPFKSFLFAGGENCLWIGLVITFLYTGLMHSRLGNGQSLAKRLFAIQVLRMDGQYLSLGQSFFRYTVIAFAFYNAWIGQGLLALFPFLGTVFFNTLYSAAALAVILSLIFGVSIHPQKRGLHDLIAGSVVVREGEYDAEELKTLYNRPRAIAAYSIVGALIIGLILGSLTLNRRMLDPGQLNEIYAMQETILNSTHMRNISITHNRTKRLDSSATFETVLIKGFVLKKHYDDKTYMRNLEHQILEQVSRYSGFQQCQSVQILYRTGYNIGIWSYYINHSSVFTPDEVRGAVKTEQLMACAQH